MQSDLIGRTAIVTGASRGIGLAIAKALVDEGANVVLTSRTQQAADEAAASIGSDRAIGFEAHATDEDAAARCVDHAIATFGSLDILVNNAGTNPAFGPMVEQSHDRFAKTLDVNLWAPVMWTGAAWRAYMSEHGGVVVNTASIGGFVVGAKLGTYNTSKAALIHATKHLAVELAPNVRVNAVAPGVVRTKLAEALWKTQEDAVASRTLVGRIGEPEDVASAVVFLASDCSSWITGETIIMDGGSSIATAVAAAEG